MLKVFTIKFESNLESFNDSILANFLSDKTVVRWESHFFTNKNEHYWTVIVEYTSLSTPSAPLSIKKEKKKNEEYKKILTGNDWPLFKRLREWRSEKGKAQGVPPYIILTNVQLAHISATRPQSLNALQEIQGVGNAKKQKYGDDKKELHLHKAMISDFLYGTLRLQFKEKACFIAPCVSGVPFLGFRIFPGIIRMKNENKRRWLKKLRLKVKYFELGLIDEEKYAASLRSMSEHIKIANTYHFRRKILNGI
jgi:hypothetical protein